MFDAVIDTGFTGFISMPQVSALPLGLNLYGTVSIELADGDKATRLTAKGMVEVLGEEKAGVVILEPNSKDVLLGMAFLSVFGRALFLSNDLIFLVDKRVRSIMMDLFRLLSEAILPVSIPTPAQDKPVPHATKGKQAKTLTSVAAGRSAGRGGKAKPWRNYNDKFHGFQH
ncbi:MAG: hypothetical protein ABSC77_14215 [Terracidiphilus sp.]